MRRPKETTTEQLTDLDKLVRDSLKGFLVSKRGIVVATSAPLGDNLFVINQAPIQTTEEGRRKFREGLDTVYLTIGSARHSRTVLARLSEQSGGEPVFTIDKLHQYTELVESHKDALQALIK